MYVDHLQRWLKVYPPEAMLIVPSESLKEAQSFKQVMERFATLVGLPRAGPQVNNQLIFKASPASTDGKVSRTPNPNPNLNLNPDPDHIPDPDPGPNPSAT